MAKDTACATRTPTPILEQTEKTEQAKTQLYIKPVNMEVDMPKARKHQIALEATPYYHCVSRCIRRAFLCGTDSAIGQCFEHRRQWLEDRILTLAQIFAIDVAAIVHVAVHRKLAINHAVINALMGSSDLSIFYLWNR